jgi:hypothetical protein
MKELMEVKTSDNYKIGKQTINKRIGEDFFANKPIMNYTYNDDNQNSILN